MHLYTERKDIDGMALVLRDGNLPLYAKLGDVGTSLRIRHGNRVFSVVSETVPTGEFVIENMEWICPQGIKKVKIEGDAGSLVANVVEGKKYVFRVELHEAPNSFGFIFDCFCNDAYIYSSPPVDVITLYYAPEINQLVATKTL